MSFDPSIILFNRYMGARVWFAFALVTNLYWMVFNMKMTDKLKEPVRIAVMDNYGNFMQLSGEHFDKVKSLRSMCAKNATLALLTLSPTGHDLEHLFDAYLLDSAKAQAKEDWKEFEPEFQKRKIHQKVEITEYVPKLTPDGYLAKVTGQLILTGSSYEYDKFAASQTFEVIFTFKRNTNFMSNDFAPFAASKYNVKFSKIKFNDEVATSAKETPDSEK